MIGEAPQPGETPRSEGDPWSFGDPDAGWWRGETERTGDEAETSRHPRRRPPRHQTAAGGTGTLLPPTAPRADQQQYTGAAAEAHAVAARDVAAELNPAPVRPAVPPLPPLPPLPSRPPVVPVAPPTVTPPPVEPTVLTPPLVTPIKAPVEPVAEAAAEVPAVESDHDRPDPHRYDPLEPQARYTAKVVPETVAADQENEPDVMVLPEVNPRNRPTVPLERRSVPGSRQAPSHRPTEPLPPLTGSPATDARLEKLENSPFWRDPTDDTLEVPPPAPGAHTAVRTHRSRPRRTGRLPVSAQISLVTLGLLAAFFGWVSAEPFWLAVGHGDRGYATTAQCSSSGVTQRCIGQFTSADGRYTVSRVILLGVEPGGRAAGSTAEARMVSPDSRQAYLGSTPPLLHLRWILGFTLVLVCGYAVAGLTGARRLENSRARRGAVLLSLAGPVTLLAGFLIAAY
jgi:hypothetical protein